MDTDISDIIRSVEHTLSTTLEGVNTGLHERGGREFVWNTTEIGHIHWNGDLDILFTKNIRVALVQAGITQIHKWVPESGWTTFQIQNIGDSAMAENLLRLSYLHKRFRKSSSSEEQHLYTTQLTALPFPASVFEALGV
ncbi:MAG: DUF5519 family protein [Candidatus Kapabacteria bacterium]|jgi:hypothetical protein|nr:DUF5519 family protein [Candidatus Kapabacteria bacterium]